MDLFDFFFPDQAQARHLRKIASNRSRAAKPNSIATSAEIQSLRDDVNFLVLVVTALLRRSSETKNASLADVQDIIDEIDGLDGMADGGLEPGVLRGILGVLKESDDEPNEFEIDTTRYRKKH